jgi:GMP synthase (glutamine-hydrolysing)
VAKWAADDADDLADYDVASILSRVRAAEDDLRLVWQPFAERFAGVVADPSIAAAPTRLQMTVDRGESAQPITDPAEVRAALAAEMQAVRGTHGR